jgi:hypothetical protein
MGQIYEYSVEIKSGLTQINQKLTIKCLMFSVMVDV